MESQSATVMVIDEVNNMQSKIEELDSKMAAMGQWKEEKEEQVAAQISELRAAFQEQTQEQAKSTQAQISRLATDFFRLQSATAKNNVELEEWVERAMLAEGELREAQEKVDQLTGSNRQLEAEVNNKSQLLEEANQTIALKESEKLKLAEEVALNKRKTDGYIKFVEDLQSRLERQMELQGQLQGREEALAATLKEREGALAAAQEQAEADRAHYEELIEGAQADQRNAQAAYKQLEQYIEGLTLEMTVVKAEVVRGREREAALDRKYRQRDTLVKEMQAHLNAMIIQCSIDEEVKEAEKKQEAEVDDLYSSESESFESAVKKAVAQQERAAPLSPPLAPAAVPGLPEATTQVEPAEKKEVATSTSA